MFRKASLLLLAALLAAPAYATDLSITAADVAAAALDTTIRNVRAGETITAGTPVYRNTSDNEYYKCDADDSSTTAACAGIAISGGVDGSYVTIVTAGRLKLGATLTVGTQYFVSATAGGIMPGADLATGDYITSLGTVIDADTLLVDINITGAQKP